jgi:1,4-dihydroxy-2-naphthoate octaprenyltransferase
MNIQKFKTYVIQAPRWFAAPFFAASLITGSQLAGGININAWIALIAALLIMGGSHVLNSWGDWITGLDKGEVEDRSAEKVYTGGSNLIAKGKLSLRETFILGMVYYLLALIPVIYLAIKSSWVIIPVAIVGMCITFWYSLISKFSYTHELALGVGVGPVPMLLGMLAVNPHPNYVAGLLVSLPFAIVLSFAGLALDEWEDAEPNLKKGVKSLAFEVWKHSDWIVRHERRTETVEEGSTVTVTDLGEQTIKVKSLGTLQWYLTSWFLFMFFYQGLLIALDIMKPLTGLAFLVFPFLIACMLFLKSNFKKWAAILVIVGAVYVILLVVGQIFG